MSRSKAKKLYEDFHKYGPSEIGKFPNSFQIPRNASFAGPASYVLYESSKLDPITYTPPEAPVKYIHEHESGVKVYWCEGKGRDSRVPRAFQNTEYLICLGKSLGFGYVDEDDLVVDIDYDPRTFELYTIPSGKALLIVEGKEHVVAMIWGGDLRVEPRGIVG